MSTESATTTPSFANVLVLPKASRAFLVGETGTGKSTLAEVLALEYQKAYNLKKKLVRTLVCDTKPRFHAEWELNGFSTKTTGRYRKWGIGSKAFANSYVVPGNQGIKTELDYIWSLGGQTAIVHAERTADLPYVSAVASTFFDSYGAGIPRLVFVDELADFFRHPALGDIFMRIARTGRERNCALIACSQRPRKIPTEVITELKRLYMFSLSYKDDIKHVYEFGIPQGVIAPQGHAFYMYDKELRLSFPSNAYHELELK
jgi:energy-coupling factor transporter ATP-binding protein EcfA2